MDKLEAACQRLIHTTFEQCSRRSGEHHPQVDATAGIFIPERLHGIGPAAHVLHLVYHQKSALGFSRVQVARLIPLGSDPVGRFAVLAYLGEHVGNVHRLQRLHDGS